MRYHKSPQFYPVGLVSLVCLPLILIYYVHNYDLNRPHAIQAWALNGMIDYFGGYTRFDFTKSDFPRSQKTNQLLTRCFTNDSLKRAVGGSIVVSMSSDCSYQTFITLLDTLQTMHHYAMFFNTGKHFNVEYRTKEFEDQREAEAMADASRNHLSYSATELAQSSKLGEYDYILQILAKQYEYSFVFVLWIGMFIINMKRVIRHRHMRRLTSRSS